MHDHIIDESEEQLYIMAYIDILGTSIRLEKLESLPLYQADGNVKLSNNIRKNVIVPTQALRHYIRIAYENSTAQTKSSDDYRSLYNKGFKFPEISFSYFSDSVIISLPIPACKDSQTETIHHSFIFLPILIDVLNMASLHCASYGYPIRGGIDIGIGIKIGNMDTEITGSALASANRLENKIINPLIAVGDKLYNEMMRISKNDCCTNGQDAFGMISSNNKKVSNCFIKCCMPHNGMIALDFLKSKLLLTDKSAKKILMNLAKFIDEELSICNSYKEKYEFLKGYIVGNIGKKAYKDYINDKSNREEIQFNIRKIK